MDTHARDARVETRYGSLTRVEYAAFHPDGSPAHCIPAAESPLDTPLGRLVPQFSDDDLRRPRVEAVNFHPGGVLKSLPLERATEVPTPLGPMPAELVTFHPDGSPRRIFPLNGKLSGHWGWRDEAALAPELEVATPAGTVRAKFISVQFFPSSALKSLTLWPEQTIELATPLGSITARIGAAFYETGELRSLEPDQPLSVDTPIGRLTAFDNDPEGITGDVNSLAFHPDGTLAGLRTVSERITVAHRGETRLFAPRCTVNLCDEDADESLALRVAFAEKQVRLGYGAPHAPLESFPLAECSFEVAKAAPDPKTLFFPCA